MFYKPLCTMFATNNIKVLRSVSKLNLHTKSDLLVSPKYTSQGGQAIQRFSEKKAPAAPPDGRIVRQEPGVVRLGFIPDVFFTFFFPKTGVSGAGTFAFTFSIYLMSKEKFVMEHEYYGGLSMFILCLAATKFVGPMLSQYFDKDMDDYEQSMNSITANEKKAFEDSVKNEETLQWSKEGELMLIEAKRENIALQLEAAYRKRLMIAYEATKKQLEYCVIRQEVELAIIRRHMISWVVKEVSKEISDEIGKQSLSKCLQDLEKLAKTLKPLTDPYPPIKEDPEKDPGK